MLAIKKKEKAVTRVTEVLDRLFILLCSSKATNSGMNLTKEPKNPVKKIGKETFKVRTRDQRPNSSMPRSSVKRLYTTNSEMALTKT